MTTIIIVGGGIGGLACALALRRKGLSCVVFEQASELREIGAGLLLTPNACAVLDGLGVLDGLVGRSEQTPCWEILDDGGRRLQRLRPTTGRRVALSTRRSDLQQVLRAALPEDVVRLGHTATAVDIEPNAATVSFADRSSVRAELVIVADGARSRLRQSLWPERRLLDQGYVGWRAIVDGVPAGWGRGRMTESWGRGKRFGIAAVGSGQTYWYASANTAACGVDDPLTRRALLLKHFAHWHAPIPSIIADTPVEAILHHPIADAPPGRSWTCGGCVTLLGDAAHPLTPNLGQGAAMALEDGWVLAASLADGANLQDALRRYQRLRRARLAAVWAASRAVGLSIQTEAALAIGLRNAVLRATPDRLASGLLRACFAFDTA